MIEMKYLRKHYGKRSITNSSEENWNYKNQNNHFLLKEYVVNTEGNTLCDCDLTC